MGSRSSNRGEANLVDTEAAWDWELIFTLPGPKQCGAVGRTGSREQSEERMNAVLADLPAGVTAYGELRLYSGLNALCERQFLGTVAWVERTGDGQIIWSSSAPHQTRGEAT